METKCFSDSNADTSFPLSSLRLLVSPLHLASAAMWQMTQRGETMHYGKLEEFVTLVTETVPELLTCRQRAQLIQGLRMRFILELCRSEPLADPQIIQAHVNRLQSYSAPCSPAGVNDAEAEVSEANFLELVQTLLKDPAQREHFFQDVFPVQFGLKYDATLQALVWEFLSRLELLLPVPDLTQTASLLSAAPAGLEECMQCASHQQQLKTLLQHHKCFGQLTTNTLPSMDDSMVSSLSLPPLAEVAFASEQPDSGGQSESTHNPIGALSPSSFGKEAVPECLMDSTDYAGVEVELRTSVGFSEGGEEENGGIDGRTEPNCSEMEKDGQGEGKDEHTPKGDLGLSREREKESGGNKLIHAPKTGTTHPEARLRTWKEAVVTGNKKTGNNLVIALKWLPESQGKVNVNRPRNFSTRNGNTGWTVEANARVFACSKCLVFHSDEGYLHQHIKTVHPEECKEFLWGGEWKAGNPVTPTEALPLLQVQQELPLAERAVQAPAVPHGGEALPLHPVREGLQVGGRAEPAQAHPHRGETVQLLPVREDLPVVRGAPEAPEVSHRRAALQLLAVREDLHAVQVPEAAQEEPHGGEAVQLPPVPEDFLLLHASEETRPGPRRGETLPVLQVREGLQPFIPHEDAPADARGQRVLRQALSWGQRGHWFVCRSFDVFVRCEFMTYQNCCVTGSVEM